MTSTTCVINLIYDQEVMVMTKNLHASDSFAFDGLLSGFLAVYSGTYNVCVVAP